MPHRYLYNWNTIAILFNEIYTAKSATHKHYINPANLSTNYYLSSKSSLLKILEASWKMKVFALALLAFAISANASSISCGPSKTDCKEPEPVELCNYQKTCKNVCHDVVSFITDFKMKKKCHKECVKKTRKVPCMIPKKVCKTECEQRFKTETKYK